MWILGEGDLFADRYRILREIGTGGMSTVYAATDEELSVKLALKIMKPDFLTDADFVERFKREVNIARNIRHPNIVQVFDLGFAMVSDRKFYYLTMELLEGRDLAEHLRENNTLPLVDTLRIGLQVCDALTQAHRSGVVHRDIKPQNIFIDEQGQVKLMDFGISRSAALDTMTTGGQLIGTPKYMSPEQVHRKTDPDNRTDIYAFGIVLYEMCTHRTPFQGESTVEVALKQVQQQPQSPRELNTTVPAKLDDIILKCLEKEPDARYQSTKELRADLQAVPAYQDSDDTTSIPATEIVRMQETANTRSVPPTAIEADSSRVTTRARPGRVRSSQSGVTERRHRSGSKALISAAAAVVIGLVAIVGLYQWQQRSGESSISESGSTTPSSTEPADPTEPPP